MNTVGSLNVSPKGVPRMAEPGRQCLQRFKNSENGSADINALLSTRALKSSKHFTARPRPSVAILATSF
jgi:hypothetical protein